jgi:hypothetical protein
MGKREIAGFIVFEASEDFEQGLALKEGEGLPLDGILNWASPENPVYLFDTHAGAELAITRTEHYRLAFGDETLPERRFCKVVRVTRRAG